MKGGVFSRAAMVILNDLYLDSKPEKLIREFMEQSACCHHHHQTKIIPLKAVVSTQEDVSKITSKHYGFKSSYCQLFPLLSFTILV